MKILQFFALTKPGIWAAIVGMHDFHIFTMVWGAHHLNLFKEGCFRSLNWPQNRKYLVNAKWHIYTKREHFPELKEIFNGTDYRVALMDMGESLYVAGLSGFVPIEHCDPTMVLLNGLLRDMHHCLGTKERMLFAPPDTIFGDGSIGPLLYAGQQPHTAVMVPHMRVLPSILEDIKYSAAVDGGFSNASLVSLAMRHPHASWVQSEKGNEKQSSFESGVLWEKVSKSLYQVQHRLPTAYLVDFTEDDASFWWGSNGFGNYDHRWPGENLIRQERQRYVGSSDACFIIEVTDHDKNVSKITPPELRAKLPVDGYFNIRHHNSHNRQMLCYFRGE